MKDLYIKVGPKKRALMEYDPELAAISDGAVFYAFEDGEVVEYVWRNNRLEPKHHFQSYAIGTEPRCRKCKTRPRKYYGPIGGFSKQCQECNDEKNEKSRARSKRRRELNETV